jgi:5'(3')-deoxyribonucleotidase
MEPKIVYFDMDGVLVDFDSGIAKLDAETKEKFKGQYDNVPGIFDTMDPFLEMVAFFELLSQDPRYDCYLLSTPPWSAPSSWGDKGRWVKRYLPSATKRLILSHHKHLNRGDYLIDDSLHNKEGFKGKFIHWTGTHTCIGDLYREFAIVAK